MFIVAIVMITCVREEVDPEIHHRTGSDRT